MKFFKNCFKAVTAALLVLNCAYCEEILLPTDWQQKGLKGKVKKMTEIEYKYHESKLEETWIVTTEFNESGYVTKMTQHINGRRNRTNVYEYDKYGNLTQRTSVNLKLKNDVVKEAGLYKKIENKYEYYE